MVGGELGRGVGALWRVGGVYGDEVVAVLFLWGRWCWVKGGNLQRRDRRSVGVWYWKDRVGLEMRRKRRYMDGEG